MRLQTSVILGLWHPYKAALEAVWKKHAHTFLAPAFHALFPTGLCFAKPKLVTILVMFTYLRRVYPSIAGSLQMAIDSETRSQWKSNLIALQTLFEYFIPVVSFSLFFYFWCDPDSRNPEHPSAQVFPHFFVSGFQESGTPCAHVFPNFFVSGFLESGTPCTQIFPSFFISGFLESGPLLPVRFRCLSHPTIFFVSEQRSPTTAATSGVTTTRPSGVAVSISSTSLSVFGPRTMLMA